MLQLHDRTRRQIALAIFFALGVLPTLAVTAWGLWWRSAWHARAEAERLGWQLGLHVTLGAVRHPRPGVVVYEGLQLREPETNQPVFRCRAIEARAMQSAGASEGPRAALHLRFAQPEINAAQWGEVWRLVDRVLSCRAGLADRDLAVAAEQLTLAASPQSQRLVEVQGKLERQPAGTEAEVRFRLGAQTESQPARLRVLRSRQMTPPTTALELDTSGHPLPCPLLAIGLGGFGRLGPPAQFCGTLWATLSREGPSGELSGHFSPVDLDCLVSDRPPHQLTGTADIQLDVARFSQGRLQEAAGSVRAGPGLVSRSLLEIAVQRLGLGAGPGFDDVDQILRYDRLSVAFACDEAGLRLGGGTSGGAAGAILAGRRGAILREPQPASPPLSLETVVRAFHPAADTLVPIARRSDGLLPRAPTSSPGALSDVENPLR